MVVVVVVVVVVMLRGTISSFQANFVIRLASSDMRRMMRMMTIVHESIN